jgi:hypothetical protein
MRARFFWVVFVILIGLHVALMLIPRIFPLIDLPYQLSAATIYRFHGTPGDPFADFYDVKVLPNPNVAHFLFCGSGLVPGGVETANRIFLILCVILLPAATALTLRRWGGDPWLSLPAFMLVYHYSFSWGFPGYALAVPFVLIGALILGEHRQRPRAWLWLVLVVWPLLLYGMHLLAALFFAWLLALHAATLLRRAPRRALADLVAVVPLAALVIFWQTRGGAGGTGPGVLPELRDYYTVGYARTLVRRAAVFLWDNHAVLRGAAGFAVATVFSGTIAALAVVGFASTVRRRDAAKRATSGPTSGPTPGPIDIAVLLLIAAASAYLLVPFQIPGTAHLFERFSVLVMLALLLYAAGRVTLGSRMRLVVLGLCLAHWGLWADYYSDFRSKTADFDRSILPEATPGTVLGAFIFDADFRGRPIFIHFPDYFTVWKQGISVSKVGDYRFYPIHRRAPIEILPVYDEWIGKFGTFDGTSRGYDGSYAGLGYLITRGSPPPELRHALAGYQVARTQGDWTLYQRVP